MGLQASRLGNLVVSIDLSSDQEESKLVMRLLEVLGRHQTPALWCLEFSRSTQVVDRIREGYSSHEFGVLGREDWASPAAGRTAFARELGVRLHCAAEQAVQPIALGVQTHEAPSHFDLLVKHQLKLIRTRTDKASGSAGALQPRLARYGIWESPPGMVVPVSSRWSLPWTVRRALQQTVERAQTWHVAVHGERLAENASAGLGSLDYVLKLASARREAGQLQTISPSQLVQLHAPRRDQVTSRSVLRAA